MRKKSANTTKQNLNELFGISSNRKYCRAESIIKTAPATIQKMMPEQQQMSTASGNIIIAVVK